MLVRLDPAKKSEEAEKFISLLQSKVIGQERAVRCFGNLIQAFYTGLSSQNKPLGITLLLGPTGTGKTRIVEAIAEIIFNDPNAVLKIDCAEYQHSHDIARLIGAPPGYLGHRETGAMLSQVNVDYYQIDGAKFSLILFDEIEKASPSLWQLLLGILDKATLSLGSGNKVDFSKTFVVMTSNLGAREMCDLISGHIGFAPKQKVASEKVDLDLKIYHTALQAAKHKFSPEFMNRIDKVIAFRSLSEYSLFQILEIELTQLQNRITKQAGIKFVFVCTDRAKEFLFKEGYNPLYGARHINRSIERFLTYPLSNIATSGQLELGSIVRVDHLEKERRLGFSKLPATMIIEVEREQSVASGV